MRKTLVAAALATAALTQSPALAQDVPEAVASALTVGATVYAPDGSEVGTVEDMPGGNVLLFTGKNRATLPAASFGINEKGLLIGMTKVQLDSAIEAAEAKVAAAKDAALVAGASIASNDGVAIGSIQKVEGDNVVVDLPDGRAVTLKKDHFTLNGSQLQLGMTAAQFQSAVSAVAQPQA